MRINTITCHDVYNVGASLQAYALSRYLRMLGHEASIINYKPDYLTHYRLTGVANSRYDKPILREAYLLMKLPGRIAARFSKRKKEFDAFTEYWLPLTEREYSSNSELKENPPEADLYIAGSDQIWNTLFPNGKDPAFYLDFVPEGKRRASYAASFATEDVEETWKPQVGAWLSKLDYISVRENSGIQIVKKLAPEKNAVSVLDPVFLLNKNEWEETEKNLQISEPYLLVYDFDQNPVLKDYAIDIANEKGWRIFSVQPLSYAEKAFDKEGPQASLYLIHHAQMIVSNSFHATAFSLIYEKPFAVFDRNEKINSRMHDLVAMAGFSAELVGSCMFPNGETKNKLDLQIKASKAFIDMILE